MRIKYYETISRNEKTGKTTFLASPLDYVKEAKDGLIECVGIIPILNKGTPLEIEGQFKNKQFELKNVAIIGGKVENEKILLEYICDSLTDKQMDKIIYFCNGSVLDFSKSKKNELTVFLNDLLKQRKNSKIIVGSIISNIDFLLSSEVLTKFLLKIEVPLDSISKLISKKISYNQIINSPYYYFLKFGIDVKYADRLVDELGKLKECEYSFARLCGFTYSAMLLNTSSGNTCITLNELCEKTQYVINSQGLLRTQVNKSIVNTCVMEMVDLMAYHSINGKNYIYLNHIWDEECVITDSIRRLQSGSIKVNKKIDIDEIEKSLGFKYNNGQRKSFGMLESTGIKILTGPPGAGKTAVLNGIIKAFKSQNRGVVKLAATTGMASKIMAKATGCETETVNKMLNVIPFENTILAKDEANRLDADLIIVDEMSMLGLQLAAVLFSAIKTNATLILVGDEDQLESVEYGNVLSDLIRSGKIEIYKLTEIMRQKGSICTNAKLVNEHKTSLNNDDSFIAYECCSEEMMKVLFDKYYTKGTQVLCPIKNGNISVNTYNEKLQLKTTPILLTYGKTVIRCKDKVVITKTSYENGFINGDVGYALSIDESGLSIELLNGETVIVPREFYSYVELAYCLTIHKSQGSEYENVIVLLPDTAKCMLKTRLIYTAVTRARKRVVIISVNNSLNESILNIYEKKRQTMLCERLINCT